MSRVHNFNAGPAALPLPVLERAQREMLDYAGSGMSIMEHSHRGAVYDKVHNEAIALLRELLDVPDDYHVLFCQGGASLQFAMLAMNFIPEGGSADYVVTGAWSKKALKEATIIASGREAASGAVDGQFVTIPQQLDVADDAAFVHITSNNTISGTQFHSFPEVGPTLIADMSSDFLWRPIDVRKFGMIYAGAQKNVGPSGLAIVLLRDSLLQTARENIPTILRYKTFVDKNSLYNTPNTFAIYMVRNVLAHIADQGGLAQVEKDNRDKGALLYDAIDAHPDFYRCPVDRSARSLMNVVMRLPSEELEKKFVAESTAQGLIGLKGHRSVGGLRASIYNACPRSSVAALVAFMDDFRNKNS